MGSKHQSISDLCCVDFDGCICYSWVRQVIVTMSLSHGIDRLKERKRLTLFLLSFYSTQQHTSCSPLYSGASIGDNRPNKVHSQKVGTLVGNLIHTFGTFFGRNPGTLKALNKFLVESKPSDVDIRPHQKDNNGNKTEPNQHDFQFLELTTCPPGWSCSSFCGRCSPIFSFENWKVEKSLILSRLSWPPILQPISFSLQGQLLSTSFKISINFNIQLKLFIWKWNSGVWRGEVTSTVFQADNRQRKGKFSSVVRPLMEVIWCGVGVHLCQMTQQ